MGQDFDRRNMKDMKKQTCDMGGFSLMWFMFLMSKFSPPSNPVNPVQN